MKFYHNYIFLFNKFHYFGICLLLSFCFYTKSHAQSYILTIADPNHKNVACLDYLGNLWLFTNPANQAHAIQTNYSGNIPLNPSENDWSLPYNLSSVCMKIITNGTSEGTIIIKGSLYEGFKGGVLPSKTDPFFIKDPSTGNILMSVGSQGDLHLLGRLEINANNSMCYFVSTAGSYSNNGAYASPFDTIPTARDYLRANCNTGSDKSSMDSDIVVYLRGGTYSLNVNCPITMDYRNSGNNGHNVIYKAYPSEVPCISGGLQITNPWTGPNTNSGICSNTLTADTRLVNNLTSDTDHSLWFRQLYVNGQRAVRARWPHLTTTDTLNQYYTTTDTTHSPYLNVKSKPYNELNSYMCWYWDGTTSAITLNTSDATNSRLNTLPANSLHMVEFVFLTQWMADKIHIDHLSTEAPTTPSTTLLYPSKVNKYYFNEDGGPNSQVDSLWDNHRNGYETGLPCDEGYTLDGYAPYYLENALAFLGAPNEWYLDLNLDSNNKPQSHILYYIPPHGNISGKTFTVPQQDKLLSIQGGYYDASKKMNRNGPVHNIQFKGLTFEYSSQRSYSDSTGTTHGLENSGPSLKPEAFEGVIPYLGTVSEGSYVGPAISVRDADHIDFEENIFIHLGGHGLSFCGDTTYSTYTRDNDPTGIICKPEPAHDNTVNGNIFTDISGTAIIDDDYHNDWWNDWYEDRFTTTTYNNVITNNFIYNVANEYYTNVGICSYYSNHSTISNNEITSLPYTGIFLGMTDWQAEDTSFSTIGGFNTISNNDIHDVMQLMRDGGAIFTEGRQPGTTMASNYIHHLPENNLQLVKDTNNPIYKDAPYFPYRGSNCIYLDTDPGGDSTGTLTFSGNQFYDIYGNGLSYRTYWEDPYMINQQVRIWINANINELYHFDCPDSSPSAMTYLSHNFMTIDDENTTITGPYTGTAGLSPQYQWLKNIKN